ncbi:hypothetical protein BGW80DRAFT_63944 [Lactifluus volemus]|nr:hypothetical protein BGW80DRAFT_63944 [Lactifluus volemus]
MRYVKEKKVSRLVSQPRIRCYRRHKRQRYSNPRAAGKYVPSELKETPNHVCDNLILLFKWHVRRSLSDSCTGSLSFCGGRSQAKRKVDRRRLSRRCLSSSTIAYGTCQPTTRSASCAVCCDVCNTDLLEEGAECSNQNMPATFRLAQKLCATLLTRARAVARGPVCPSVITSLTNRLYSFVSPLSRGGCSMICPLASHTNGCGLMSPRDK